MGAKSRGNFAHQPNPEWCCPGCIWPNEPHSDWCGKGKGEIRMANGATLAYDHTIPEEERYRGCEPQWWKCVISQVSVCHCQSARTIHASADGICCGRCGGEVK